MSAFPIKKSDLKIVVKNFDTKDGILLLHVPYPKNYPNTEFKLNNLKNQIGYLQIDFSEVKDKNYINLDFFFVHSSKSSMIAKYATKEEIELSKGLGKKCYVTLLTYL